MPIKKIKHNYRKARYVFYKETLVDYREHFGHFLDHLSVWVLLLF